MGFDEIFIEISELFFIDQLTISTMTTTFHSENENAKKKEWTKNENTCFNTNVQTDWHITKQKQKWNVPNNEKS